MQINGPAHVHGPQPINPPHKSPSAQPSVAPAGMDSVDQLDISEAAQTLSQVHDLPDIRRDRVDGIRAQIAEGIYDTEEKLDIAIERLLDEMA